MDIIEYHWIYQRSHAVQLWLYAVGNRDESITINQLISLLFVLML